MSQQDTPPRPVGDRIAISHGKGRPGWLSLVDGTLILELAGEPGANIEPLFWCPLASLLSVSLRPSAEATIPTRQDSQSALQPIPVPSAIDISALTPKAGHLQLHNISVYASPEQEVDVAKWIARAMAAAYEGQKFGRRVLLLVNPAGGKGKGKALVERVALPILRAAGCEVKVVETEYSKHAEELAQTISLDYDVIATASGDGLIHEFVNGFASRVDARRAFRIPIVPIPTGSANGLCINLQGVDETFNIPLACLNVIKGKAMPLDLCSVMVGKRRRWSFMTIAAGLMCDVDLGTEHLRWMGDARFVYGFIRGLAANRPMKCKVHIKVVTADKALMIQRLNAKRHQIPSVTSPGNPNVRRSSSAGKGEAATAIVPGVPVTNTTSSDEDMPPFRELAPDTEEGWITLESGTEYGTGKKSVLGDGAGGSMQDPRGTWRDGEGILYIYTGLVPYVARDLMQFPVVIPGEGLVDVCVQTLVPRAVLAGSISGAEKGEPFYLDCQHYYKASAFVIEPLEENKLVSIDGEAFPFERMTVECHAGLARTCSLNGGWAANPFGAGKKK